MTALIGRAGNAAQGRLRALLFLPSFDYSVAFTALLEAMLAAGHQVTVALDGRAGLPAERRPLDELRSRYPAFDYTVLGRRTDLWRIPGSAVRRSLDYLRYLGPEYASAGPLRARARDRTPRLVRALLRLPPFRWQAGRRALGRFLGRVEAALPIPRRIRSFLAEQSPRVVVVSPLVDFGSAQGDYLRTASDLGIPSALVVTGWNDLTGKGAIRDLPTLTIVGNVTQVDEAIRFHGLPPDRVTAVDNESDEGVDAAATPAIVAAIERAATAEAPRTRDGRILRPVLRLLTPLLAIALPLLRPVSTARAVGKTVRRRARKLSPARRRKARARAAKQDRAARAPAARRQKLARAEARRNAESRPLERARA